MARLEVFLVLFGLAGVVLCQEYMRECGECEPETCEEPKKCPAGIVKDNCKCCDVCAKAEHELCNHPELPSNGIWFGDCGEMLECRMRDDLKGHKRTEALCYCIGQETICGSDGKTYKNICQMNAAAAHKGKAITAKSGRCKSEPTIISPPANTRNRTGENVNLACEGEGFPIPAIEWTWTRVDGKTEFLPGDNSHVSVSTRGGPEKWQITGWLQIENVQRDHEGDYTCFVQNDLGLAQASARVKVIDDSNKLTKDEEY